MTFCAHCGLEIQETTELRGMGRYRHVSTGLRGCLTGETEHEYPTHGKTYAEPASEPVAPELAEPDWDAP